MQESTDLCQLPAKFGIGYKWPTLSEAYTFVTGGEELVGGHDAMVDAEACAKVFRYLVEEGHVTLENFACTRHEDGEGSYNDTVQELMEKTVPVYSPSSFNKMETSNPTPFFSVRGNTYAHKETLKELGGRWNSASKEWEFFDDTHLSRLKLYVDLHIVILE